MHSDILRRRLDGRYATSIVTCLPICAHRMEQTTLRHDRLEMLEILSISVFCGAEQTHIKQQFRPNFRSKDMKL